MAASKVALGKGDASSTLAQSRTNSRTGGGARLDWPLDLGGWRDSSFLVLTGGTTPLVEVSSTMPRITWASSDSHHTLYSFKADGRIAEVNNEFILVASMKQTGSTDTITITATVTIERPGYGTVGPFTATRVLTKGASVVQECYFDFSGQVDSNKLRIQHGDNVVIDLVPSAHTTDACYLYGTILREATNDGLTGAPDAAGVNHRFCDYANVS